VTSENSSEFRLYDKYPLMARRARGMRSDVRSGVRAWHGAILQGFEKFVQAYSPEARRLGVPLGEREEAVGALRSWGIVMRDLGSLLMDYRPAEWCCAVGMAAWPNDCHQHADPSPGELRRDVEGREYGYVEGKWRLLGGELEEVP
jgi:hypothetical protein